LSFNGIDKALPKFNRLIGQSTDGDIQYAKLIPRLNIDIELCHFITSQNVEQLF